MSHRDISAEMVFRPLPQLVIEANVNPQELEALHSATQYDPMGYWEDAANELDWFKRWDTSIDTANPRKPVWFPGSLCNIAHNALDRHIESPNKNKLALIWEGEPGDSKKYTYYELYREVNRLASALRSLGVEKGDRIILFLPALPETVMAMLATAKLGAVHCFLHTETPTKTIAARLKDLSAKAVITADGFYRNGQITSLKERLDDALESGGESVDSVIVVRRIGSTGSMVEGRDFWFDDLVRGVRPVATTEPMTQNDPLFIVHTSPSFTPGTAVVHTHAGYMVGNHRVMDHVFDAKPTDIHWCYTDPARISGHSMAIYGPLLVGSTTVMYEGHPNYPRPDRLWTIIERHGVTVFMTAPSVIRRLMRFGSHYPEQNDLSTLRLLGLTGEPSSDKSWLWFYRHVGGNECPVLDCWMQTETGIVMASPFPVSLIRPGWVSRALPGIQLQVCGDNGSPLAPGQSGNLHVTSPWPGMMRSYWNAEEEFDAKFTTAGAYITGDRALMDDKGNIRIEQRVDGMIKIDNQRIHLSEIVKALLQHPAVAEASAKAVIDSLRGKAVKAVVRLETNSDQSEELARELKDHLKRELGELVELKSLEITT